MERRRHMADERFMDASEILGMPDPEIAWRAVVSRDASFQDRFVYGVTSTGVYCRPGCPSRTPKREHVELFGSPADAEAAGYRGCKRCRPHETRPSAALRSVRAARTFLDEHVDKPVTLERLADAVHVSPFHLQRTFKRYVGLTPRQYLDTRRAERLRSALREPDTVSRAAFAAGYSSSSRLYEQADAHLGMTPGDYKAGGRGVRISYATARTPIGRILVAATRRGICAVRIGEDEGELAADLRKEYPAARVEPGDAALESWVRSIVAFAESRMRRLDIPLDVRATTFQWRVWSALREIPYGSTRTYGDVARAIGRPGAARAVARACAANPTALVVPCHRVVPRRGGIGGYRWGEERKRQLLDLEAKDRQV